ncbi:MAG: hypothetical protein NEHIOOID_00703 [Holosporales bacterium]
MTDVQEPQDEIVDEIIEEKPPVKNKRCSPVLWLSGAIILQSVILIGAIKFITPFRHWLFLEMGSIEKVSSDIETVTRVNEGLATKSAGIDKMLKDIEQIKKQAEDDKSEINTKIQSIYDWMKNQNVPNADAVINKVSDDEKNKNALVDALTKNEETKDILEKIRAHTLKDEYKTLIVMVEEMETTKIPTKADLIKAFDGFYKASKTQGSDEKALEGFSSQFINQIKRNIKITVDGKESKNTLKDAFENVKKKLDDGHLQEAVDALESIQDIDDLKKLVKDIHARIALDNLIQKLSDFKGPFNE